MGAIKRTQKIIGKNRNYLIWKADIEKYFDSINHNILLEILHLRIKDKTSSEIIKEIIGSYYVSEIGKNKKGIPIGNLTSQIFANIYLNELDRFVKNYLKPRFYLRYGDDFIIVEKSENKLRQIRDKTVDFLSKNLDLKINKKNDIIIKPNQGLKFLGTVIYPSGRKLNKRNIFRAGDRLKVENLSSYQGIAKAHQLKLLKEINWRAVNFID